MLKSLKQIPVSLKIKANIFKRSVYSLINPLITFKVTDDLIKEW